MFIKSFKPAVQGIIATIRSERNFRIMLVMFALVLIAGMVFKITFMEWIMILICSGGTFALEMINTALENTVDLVTTELHPLAKKAKDVAAGAVLLWSMFSAIVGLLIFVPKIWVIFHLIQ